MTLSALGANAGGGQVGDAATIQIGDGGEVKGRQCLVGIHTRLGDPTRTADLFKSLELVIQQMPRNSVGLSWS
jgi:hypothetical protein